MVPVDRGDAALDIINRMLGIPDNKATSFLLNVGDNITTTITTDTSTILPSPTKFESPTPTIENDETTDVGDSKSFAWFFFVGVIIFGVVGVSYYRKKLGRVYRSVREPRRHGSYDAEW